MPALKMTIFPQYTKWFSNPIKLLVLKYLHMSSAGRLTVSKLVMMMLLRKYEYTYYSELRADASLVRTIPCINSVS